MFSSYKKKKKKATLLTQWVKESRLCSSCWLYCKDFTIPQVLLRINYYEVAASLKITHLSSGLFLRLCSLFLGYFRPWLVVMKSTSMNLRYHTLSFILLIFCSNLFFFPCLISSIFDLYILFLVCGSLFHLIWAKTMHPFVIT